jgi:hypothetical protein
MLKKVDSNLQTIANNPAQPSAGLPAVSQAL